MSNCIKNCRLCRNIVISTAVTVVTVDGVDWFYGYVPDGVGICCTINTVKDLKHESRLEVDTIDEYIDLWIESGNYRERADYGFVRNDVW